MPIILEWLQFFEYVLLIVLTKFIGMIEVTELKGENENKNAKTQDFLNKSPRLIQIASTVLCPNILN